MKKYSKVSELTETYLNGKLDRVLVEYENENTLVVSVSYAAGFNGVYNYSVKLNNNNDEVNFLSHKCKDMGVGIKLDRDMSFEVALSSFFQKDSKLVVA